MLVKELQTSRFYLTKKLDTVYIHGIVTAVTGELIIEYRTLLAGTSKWSQLKSFTRGPKVVVNATEIIATDVVAGLPELPIESVPTDPVAMDPHGTPDLPKRKPIPGNSKSKFCVQCQKPNKEVQLLTSTSYFCPRCE